MTEEQLVCLTKQYDIEGRITADEIRSTGSNVADIDSGAFESMCKLRKDLDSPIYFIVNGMTTGRHKSKGHPEGKAMDVRIPRLPFYTVFKAAIAAGFNKIGVYWNGKAYSYHLEVSPYPAFWMGTKSGVGPKYPWTFSKLIKDPAKV